VLCVASLLGSVWLSMAEDAKRGFVRFNSLVTNDTSSHDFGDNVQCLTGGELTSWRRNCVTNVLVFGEVCVSLQC
jgi:hypothetical protein